MTFVKQPKLVPVLTKLAEANAQVGCCLNTLEPDKDQPIALNYWQTHYHVITGRRLKKLLKEVTECIIKIFLKAKVMVETTRKK